ncbi:LD-carboxypeptidase [Flavobacterium sp. AG291]|uniref:S66 peptidase family protein n=1 Tax=Flavobacterium sp. AG291 TaxID=2184000 RepID=UPI000E2E0841|nr:LD-carboxypeptidase [Flavobacterium sp. AG291]RDI08521.1 muramoyltetrapeptide carboxypeptidase [Flavobacterium sp. AG291]
MSVKIPPYLKKGDTVGILATARKVDMAPLEPAIQLLKSWGLNVVIGKTVGLDNNQLAGQDWQRAQDFQNMLDNPNIKAIWTAKGGYGTVRMIDRLDFTKFKQHPKWLVGFSDFTVMHSHVNNFDIATLHSIACISVKGATPEAIEGLRKGLMGGKIEYNIEPHTFNKTGKAHGELIGGNLSVLYSIMGSASEADYKGKIIFIEDLDEYLYHIDRMMMNLKRNGYFKDVKGIIIGGMTKMRDNDIPWGHDALEIIQDITKEYNIPICFNFPAGHIKDNRALVFGKQITLDVSASGTKITFD